MQPDAIDGQPGPAIYFMDAVPQKDDFGAASNMGFNIIGCSYLSDKDLPDVVKEAHAQGLSVLLDLNVLSAQHDHELSSRPDRSVAADGLGRFTDLAESDPAVDWWDAKIAGWQAAGVVGFRCLDIGQVNPAIWRRLIEAAKSRSPATRFFAWTPGLGMAVIEAVASVGFDNSFSSSCWWDFKAAWLTEDAKRMALIGPEIALAAAPNTKWPVGLNERKRAVIFAATYSAGWLMPAGFQDEGLVDEVTRLNKLRAETPAFQSPQSASVVSSAGANIAVLRRGANVAVAINASSNSSAHLAASSVGWRIGGQLQRVGHVEVLETLALSGGEILICEVSQPKPIISAKRLPVDCDAPRISVEVTAPKVDSGQFPVRRLVGERVTISADIICDGHDKLAAEVLWRPADEPVWRLSPMVLVANDRWQGDITLDRLGSYVFAVRAWKDFYATFVDEITKKQLAGVSIHLEIKEGVALIRETAKAAGKKNSKGLVSYIEKIEQADEADKLRLLVSDELVELMRQNDARRFVAQTDVVRIDAERLGARFSNWYEIFPRSQSGDGVRHGTFQDVIQQLPRISAMGFDVLYFPPIHPIGRSNRKGRNNTLTPAIDDPGSPYAIGSVEGGHDAVHPELGTIQDFDALQEAAAAHGIELALDFAVQCAPDHPWLKEHKEWFDWRLDGSIRYAENPPKKYEDIVNVDFYAEGAKPSLWTALRDIVQFWVDHGVRLFRVDNPHTKPFPFWEWLIADIRSRHPDVLFLAEAFTRPKIMYRLAKIGFSQSYTYFTWRNTKPELTEYLTELNETEVRDYFRPHFFVNTPDINPFFLQNAERSGFLIRAALAATLSGLWGVYNGFELCEAAPFAPGKEEYVDSEKYQLRAWDHNRAGNIVAEVTKLNSIRRSNAALQSHLGVRFHEADDENVICYSKSASDGNFVFVVVSLDMNLNKDVRIEVPLWLFDLPDDGAIFCEDLMRDFSFVWQGKSQYVNLPSWLAFLYLALAPRGGVMIFQLSDGISNLLEDGAQNWLQSEILPAYVKKRRWFASKDKTIRAVRLQSCCAVQVDDAELLLAEIQVDLGDGQEVYQLHLGLCVADGSETALAAQLKLADVTWRERPAFLTDAFAIDAFAMLFLGIIESPQSIGCGNTMVVGVPQNDLSKTQDHPELKRISAEQSNSSLIIGNETIMKLIRRVMPGINPEVEMVRYLTEQHYANTPPLLGEVQRHAADGSHYSMAVLQSFIQNQGDGWEFTLQYLKINPVEFSGYAMIAAAIGQRLGELHAVLALASEDPSFAVLEADDSAVAAWSAGAAAQISKATAVLRDTQASSAQAEHDREFVLSHLKELFAVLPLLAKSGIGALLTRIHGDFHLGQVLVANNDAYIIDFEGEPAKPLEIRRAKSSPLRDVAGLLRSLDYAAASADVHERFVTTMSDEFLKAYRRVARGATRRWVVDDDQEANLLDLFLLEKSAYEICYEASNRPTWLAIPLSGFASIVRRVLGLPEASDA